MVFSKRISEEIGDGPDGLPIPDAIAGVDNNNYDSEKTDAREDLDDGIDIACKGCYERKDIKMDYMEAEDDKENSRSNNIGKVENNEVAMLD